MKAFPPTRRAAGVFLHVLGGALLLCLFSVFQKTWIGAPMTAKGFVVPCLFGGLAGFAIGVLGLRLRLKNAALRRHQHELERMIEERTAELAARSRDLERLNELNKKLFIILAHDTKNAVGGILNYFRLLIDDLDEADRARLRREMEVARKSMAGQYEHLLMILEWAKLNTGMRAFAPERVELGEVCDELFSQHHEQLIDKDIELSFHGADGGSFPVDRRLLCIALNNLVCNAVKYLPEGGEVRVSFETKPDMLVARVRDNGPGLSQDMVERLFVFSAEKIRHSNQTGGSGLGLFVVKELIEAYGGSIAARSKEAEFTEIEASFPRREVR